MNINCIAIDDEPFALKQMVSYIERTPFLNIVGACSNAFEAMEVMEKEKVDLAFIDINMPEMSGMELAKANTHLNFIFTTAYSEYAVESYKVEAIDYLLKPIAYEDFLRPANKAKRILNQDQTNENQTEESHFFIKADSKTARVNFDDIEYIESQSEYVKIILTNNKPLLSLMRLKTLEETLPQKTFMRVHRSYIVNLDKVNSIAKNRIIFNNDVYIPIGEQYKEKFKEFINKKFLG
jgi:two-component system response regulator LytT